MSVSRFLDKYAAASHIASIAPEVALVNDRARAQGLNTVKNLGLAGLGIGAGGAGLLALKNWLMPPKAPSAEIGLGPSEVDLAYPQFEGADVTPEEARALKKRKALVEHAKSAALQAPTPLSMDWLLGRPTESSQGGGVGATAGAVQPQPWLMPAAMMAGGGGLVGGAALVNWLANRRRKAEREHEVDDARKEYEDAMLSQYDPDKTHRIIDMDKGASLDRLFDRCEGAGLTKRAGGFNDMLGFGAGAYGSLAALLAAGTGYGTYKYLKGRSKSKQLEDALRSRAAARAAANPPEMFIHPVPVKRKRPLTEEVDDAGSPVTI